MWWGPPLVGAGHARCCRCMAPGQLHCAWLHPPLGRACRPCSWGSAGPRTAHSSCLPCTLAATGPSWQTAPQSRRGAGRAETCSRPRCGHDGCTPSQLGRGGRCWWVLAAPLVAGHANSGCIVCCWLAHLLGQHVGRIHTDHQVGHQADDAWAGQAAVAQQRSLHLADTPAAALAPAAQWLTPPAQLAAAAVAAGARRPPVPPMCSPAPGNRLPGRAAGVQHSAAGSRAVTPHVVSRQPLPLCRTASEGATLTGC